MTPQELKNSILQLAIQGKLVEQRPEERVTEKAAFMLSDAPFDIPETWKWAKLGDCCEMYTGNSISENEKKAKYEGRIEGFDYIGTKDVTFSQTIIYDNGVRIPYDNGFKRAYKGAILMCIEGGSAGRKIAILDRDVCFGNKLCMFQAKTLLNTYVFFFLQSFEFKRAFADNMTGIIGGVSIKKLKDILLPIPPLEEQKRIVAKIEELLPLIERYEKAWCRLEDFNKRFPVDMQKSILQMAIQGKLVEQRPEEGTGEELYRRIQTEKQALIKPGKIKKEKPLPEITEDEIPFEIPSTWKWVHWGEVINIVSARRVHQSDWKSEGIPFYRAREIAKLAENGYVENELFISQELFDEFSKSGVPQPGDLMVTAVGTLGKTYIVKQNDHFYYKDASVICFENYGHILPEYLKYVMQSEMMNNQIRSNSSGTTVATLTMVRMVEYFLPLPPLAEQKRIVARLEELLPLCERLK